jgi:hypothetical protein
MTKICQWQRAGPCRRRDLIGTDASLGVTADPESDLTIEHVEIENTSRLALAGPVSLVFDRLDADHELYYRSGRTTLVPSGSPFVTVPVGTDAILAPGERATVDVWWRPYSGQTTDDRRLVAGPGAR